MQRLKAKSLILFFVGLICALLLSNPAHPKSEKEKKDSQKISKNDNSQALQKEFLKKFLAFLFGKLEIKYSKFKKHSDKSCKGGKVQHIWYQDLDNDGFGYPLASVKSCNPPEGYVDNDLDCDDGNAMIYSGAIEVCDELDNNCNGTADEGLETKKYFSDFDEDSFGDVSDSIASCRQVSGYVEDSTDCNDDDYLINSKASELCDGIDNNCSGEVDEGLIFYDFYLDHDADGFGDINVTQKSCEDAIQGYALNSQDCDDNNFSVNPTVNESAIKSDRQCSDGIDQNCDGQDVICDIRDADEDGFNSVEFGGADCDDSRKFIYPNAVETCDSFDNNCDGQVDEGYVLGGVCQVGIGECRRAGSMVCSADGESTQCSVVAGTPKVELCDSKDNDCDGFSDDDAVDMIKWYADKDSDGYGSDTASIVSCYTISDFVDDNADCDDNNFQSRPNKREICDGIDNNCNKYIDEGCFCTPQLEICGDGIDQDCNGKDLACDADLDLDQDGYTPLSGDCNDDDPESRPNADEYCDNQDNDCDGVVDNSTAVDARTWYYDFDNDGFGGIMPQGRACHAIDPEWIEVTGDCNDNNYYTNPDWFEECGDNIDNNCDGQIDEGC